MSWLEVSFEIPKMLSEKCSEQLEQLGAVSVSFFDAGETPILEPRPGETPLWNKVKIVGLFEDNITINAVREALSDFLPNTPLQISPLADQEWTRTWLEHFHPMQFGQNLWIVPSDTTLPEDKNAAIVTLDPGLAFGTGTHPTTALCLSWLDAHPPKDEVIIDYGCGSGILGIAALKLGAKQVWAVDYDPQALTASAENAARNSLSAEQLITIQPQELPGSVKAQTILANILAEPLIKLAPHLKEYCAEGGNIVLSGLLTKQLDAVKAAYSPWFLFEIPQTQEDWVLLVGTKVNN